MKPAPFAYVVPESIEEALTLLAEHGDEAKLLAGGQSLIPAMNFRLARPAVLIDLNPLTELAYIDQTGDGGLRLGALTRMSQLEKWPGLATAAPLLAETIPHIAHPQIRNRSTVGGSLAHADPAAELPVIAVAREAQFVIRGPAGERQLSAADFFTGLFETALTETDLLIEMRLPPLPPRTGYAFTEVARRHGDYALAGVAAVVSVNPAGRCHQARLVYLNAGEGPTRVPQAEAALNGRALDDSAIAEAAAIAQSQLDPAGDIHATADFKRHLAGVLSQRALRQAWARAQAAA